MVRHYPVLFRWTGEVFDVPPVVLKNDCLKPSPSKAGDTISTFVVIDDCSFVECWIFFAQAPLGPGEA